ncbi:MAG: hypothetical protein IANPNBLG_00339 [Bryobacteraceae bacterium]|nr:hypothetical protein [Bryobacteraceae bacterium]
MWPMAAKLSRRSLALAALPFSSLLPSASAQNLPAGDDLAIQLQKLEQWRAALAKVNLATAVQPAFVFKA